MHETVQMISEKQANTIDAAVSQCYSTGLCGWALVEYAQKMVAEHMVYSYFHSFDSPKAAYEKGQGILLAAGRCP
jgi:hypothetical protein